MHAARAQSKEHYTRRYQLALDHAGNFGDRFSPELKEALQRMLEISVRREFSRDRGFVARLRTAMALQREGVYREHYNGVFTLLRDLVL